MEIPEEQIFRFEDERQDRIYRRLRLIGEGPAIFFHDACQFMDSPAKFRTTTHLVGHLMRDVESALRDVLEPQNSGDTAPDVGDSHKWEIQKILDALGIPDDHPVSQLWRSLPGKDGLQSRAHRDALFTPRPVDGEFLSMWDSIQRILDFVLEKFEQTYLDYHKVLDELLEIEHPTRADAHRLKIHTPNNLIAHGYFFNKLTSAKWLEPLSAEGLFQHPVEPERKDGGIRFVPWPQSRYLARLASSEPQVVAEIILSIPTTENVNIQSDLAEAACAMPPEQSVRLINQAKAWASGPNAALSLLPEYLGRLIGHLADGGFGDAAMDLAKIILALEITPEEFDPSDPESRVIHRRKPEAVLRDWDYQEILRLQLPAMVRSGGLETLKFFCNLLEDALLSEWGQGGANTKSSIELEDYSYVWRSNLENSDRPGNEDIQNLLIGAVRDAALQIGSDVISIEEVVSELESHVWAVFRRISLDFLHKIGAPGLSLAGSRLADEDLANRRGPESEYLDLLGSSFSGLLAECQTRILKLIESGPKADDLIDGVDQEEYARRWRWQKLVVIKDQLPSEWLDEWNSLSDEFGTTPYPRPMGFTGVWEGQKKAIGVENLVAMPIQDIVQFLDDFIPGDGFDNASQEDLARELTQSTTTEPTRIADSLSAFDGVSLVYRVGLIRGFKEASIAGNEFDWAQVLQTCKRIAIESKGLLDQSSASARREITYLIENGFSTQNFGTPFDLRKAAWSVLEILIEDPDPTNEQESDYPPTGTYGRAINTTRGRAIEAVVDYCVWVYRNLGLELGVFDFDRAPEVRDALERHLDQSIDSSPTIRSVYGRCLATLNGLDTKWVSDMLGNFFPSSDTETILRQATWEGYVCYGQLNLSLLDLLRDEYARSIDLLELPNLEVQRKPDEGLGNHILVFFTYGRLALEDPLLSRYFELAPSEVRAQVLAESGQGLRSADNPLPVEVVDRLKTLWEWRMEIALAGTETGYELEMAAFGWTFASSKLGDSWSLEFLEAALGIAGKQEIDHQVVERLASLAPEFPGGALRCLDLMVESAEEEWWIHHWADNMELVLGAGLRCGHEETSQTARALINRLAARGFLKFAALLED